jgi:SEC-C motif-containing protein
VTPCPCGSGNSLDTCCGPILAGQPAATPEALMRSRYTAYVVCDIDHLERSLAPESRTDFDRKSAAVWAKSAEWLGLTILAAEDNGDGRGAVEFVVRYREKGGEHSFHETSTFRREGDSWAYVDGKIHHKPVIRATPKVGRNEPCPCGSGKKFKQCCGA